MDSQPFWLEAYVDPLRLTHRHDTDDPPPVKFMLLGAVARTANKNVNLAGLIQTPRFRAGIQLEGSRDTVESEIASMSLRTNISHWPG